MRTARTIEQGIKLVRLLESVRFAALAVLLGAAAEGRVERVEILSRSDLLVSKSFGLAGPYEKIIARVHFKVRPDNPHNKQIVDLEKAPRDGSGEVEFSADLYLLRPKEANRGNGALLLEIPNRGGKGILRIINRASGSADPSTGAEVGDGFLMRQGFTIGWVRAGSDAPRRAARTRQRGPSERLGSR